MDKNLNLLKVENLFRDKIEFNSKDKLLCDLGGAMKESVLNMVLINLITDNKITINDDNSLTWIYAEDDDKLKTSWDVAIPL